MARLMTEIGLISGRRKGWKGVESRVRRKVRVVKREGDGKGEIGFRVRVRV